MHFDEGTAVIRLPLGHAARREEEGSQVPGGSLHLEREILSGCFAVCDQLFQGVDILFRNDALVIVHIVAVVRGQRIGVHRVAGGCGGHGAHVVLSLDLGSCFIIQLCQRAGLHQAGKLVLSEEEDICAGFHVRDHAGRGIRFGYGFNRRIEGNAQFVGSVEGFDLRLGQVDHFFRNPERDVIGAVSGREGHHGQCHDGCHQNGKKLFHKTFSF